MRYDRQILLEQIEMEGQRRLSASSVLIVGAGGLGSPAALYLTAAGVGTIGIVDPDTISLSNLNRQILHTTSDIGRPKTESARQRLQALNPETRVITYPERFQADNALRLIADYDFVLDCTDQYQNKYLVCDACVIGKKPYTFGSVLRWSGQLLTYTPGNACYRCVFPQPPSPGEHVETCADAGVLGAVAGVIGSLQAAEAIKFLTHNYRGLLTNRLMTLDTLSMRFRAFDVKPDNDCPLCGHHPTITTLKDLPPSACPITG